MSAGLIAAIVAITVCVVEGLIGIVKVLITKLASKDKDYLTTEQHMMLKALYDLHNHIDKDGVPLWYVPRSWADTQKEIVTELRMVTEIQKKTLDIIERLERRLDRIPTSEG